MYVIFAINDIMVLRRLLTTGLEPTRRDVHRRLLQTVVVGQNKVERWNTLRIALYQATSSTKVEDAPIARDRGDLPPLRPLVPRRWGLWRARYSDEGVSRGVGSDSLGRQCGARPAQVVEYPGGGRRRARERRPGDAGYLQPGPPPICAPMVTLRGW